MINRACPIISLVDDATATASCLEIDDDNDLFFLFSPFLDRETGVWDHVQIMRRPRAVGPLGASSVKYSAIVTERFSSSPRYHTISACKRLYEDVCVSG